MLSISYGFQVHQLRYTYKSRMLWKLFSFIIAELGTVSDHGETKIKDIISDLKEYIAMAHISR